MWSAVIRGEPTPRRSIHEIVVIDGAARLIRSRAARLWQRRAMAQLLNGRPMRPLAGEMALECLIWWKRRFGDLDDALLVEVLERAAVIANGEQIRERHVVSALDPDDARLVVRLARIGGAR
ncbi:MAG TPA: hypothetical protein VFA50_00080 [Stellaceae bacterium]|nr:hypothetical protein [Stellaceae bacterium]